MERQATDWENIFTNNKYDKELTCRIYNKFLKPNKRMINPIKKK